MKRPIDLVVIILLFLLLFGLLTMAAYSVSGQTSEAGVGSSPEVSPPAGGQFAVQRSVVAGGGNGVGQGQFSMHATAGQATAGHGLNGGQFRVYSGFWTPDDLMPTAANVTVSGRVMTANGQGIRNVL